MAPRERSGIMEGAVKHFSCLWVASLVCAVSAAGCGLVLDTQARELREDSGPGEDSGQQDGDVMGCMTDDECQNGNVCDGRETCVEGSCVGTDAILNCADAFDCTVDAFGRTTRAFLTNERTVERTCLLRSVRTMVCLMRFLLDS